jgi:hypothetical protein
LIARERGSDEMTHPLAEVYWIGGSPCAGKSTIADALSAATGFPVYRCDDAYFRHQELVTPEQQPVFHRLSRATGDAVWLRPVARQIAEELALYREEFPFILADLADFAAARPVIAEGAALLPELLDGIGVAEHRGIWIVPTADFQRHHYGLRDWRHDVLAACADQERAWENWMARDSGFARAVAEQARERNRRLLEIDGSIPVAKTIQTVAEWFRLPSLHAGQPSPRAGPLH